MNFIEQLAADADVFLNPDEFGESHVIEGVAILCVIDSIGGDSIAGQYEDGTWLNAVSLFARKSDLDAPPDGRPKAENALSLDGRRYMVRSVVEEGDLLRVGMELVMS